ncbi:MAG: nickel pincer cofactor biosynthesis protein LarC [Promethearchaeati archaeon SRVP18_Atabeyarchaeia-1]
MEKLGNRIMVIDCQLSGISGDMILGALLGIGADEDKVKRAVESVRSHVGWCEEIKVNVRDVMKGEFKAKEVDIDIRETVPQKGKGRSSNYLRDAVNDSVRELELSDRAQEFASKAIDTLVEAERKIHGESHGSEPELRELGSTDTVADIVGAATALDDLRALDEATIYSTPVAVGGGLFKFSHGVLQSPGPAALEILRKFSFAMIGGPVEAELITPTGASLLVNMASGGSSRFYPGLKPTAVGYGAGKNDLGDVPNVLRIVLGSTIDYELLTDRVYVLETNLDDVQGETIGFLMERLLREKVRDACIIPVTMKKGRPGQILKVMVDESEVERISRVLIDETGTLGVRGYPVRRYVASREIVPIEVSIDGKIKRVRVKIGRTRSGKVISLKPEYEDVSSISIETNKPFKDVEEIVKEEARKRIGPD